MIAAGYTLHLYCDCSECVDFDGDVKNHPGFAEFTGEDWLEVSRQATSKGWLINKDRTLCYAPNHYLNKIAK